MKVLIAEDDTVSLKVVQKTVEKLGHETLVGSDGVEAWELYRKDPDIDVVISDWMMPNMDGLELCHKVRGIEHHSYTYFIFLTALTGRDNLLEGLRAGADEYLTKPLDREQLQTRLIAASRVVSTHQHLHDDAEEDREQSNGDKGSTGDGVAGSPRQRRTGLGRKKVWDVLMERDRLTEEQLQQAIEAQKSDKRELGKVLVSLGFISTKDLAQAQAQRLGLDYAEPDESDVDREVVGLVSEKVLRKHDALPLRLEDGRLVVAMSDPTNLYAIEDLRIISGYRIRSVVVTEENLQWLQNRVFSTGAQISDVLEEATEAEDEHGDDLELGVESDPDAAPVIRLVSSILQRAVNEEASDIHVEPQPQELMVRMRIDGILHKLMSVPSKLQNGVTARLKILADLNIAERRVPQDGRFSVRLGGKKIDLRVATLPTVYGEEMVLRLLDTSSLQTDMSQLGFSSRALQSYREMFNKPYGTIIVTGPTGSGKSTTLYSTLDELNTPEKKIITVEDPVEYRLQGINQVQVNSKIGLTFASGLRSILRNDPDVVMIGEIRDPETAKTSIEAAMTGHMVLATLHTNDAPSALGRLTDMGVEPFLIASSVNCVVAQRLARRLCERCKQPVEIEREILESMDFSFEHAPEGGLRFHKAVGCRRCGESGYRGRLGIYELMLVTREIEEMILRRASTGEIAAAAERDGMMRLRDDGLSKAAEGLTSIEEVLRTVV
jgi:type IV pilus assembly protein PilB